MKKLRKLAVLLCVALLCTAFLPACSGEDEPEASPSATATAKVTPTKAPSTPTPEPTPTQAPTEAPTPAPTVEPGKETYAGGIADENARCRFIMDQENPELLKPEHLIESFGIQFFATAGFDKLLLRLPTWSQPEGHIMSFKLYPWMGSYTSTLAGEAAFETELADYTENTWLEIATGKVMPDGEYLLYLENASDMTHVGIWISEEESEMQRLYMDDYVYEGGESAEYGVAQFGIEYVKTPTNKYGPLSDPIF